MFPIDVLRFSEIRVMRNHLSETLMLNDIQITNDYMSRWVVLKRRVHVGAVTSQRVLKVLYYVNILQCFFVVENFTANAVSVSIGDNGNRLFFDDLFSIKNIADVNSIDSFVSKRNMEEFSVVIMKRFRSNWFEKTKGQHKNKKAMELLVFLELSTPEKDCSFVNIPDRSLSDIARLLQTIKYKLYL